METAEIWKTAADLIKIHGIEAEIVAGDRADRALGYGDIDNFKLWMRITGATTALSRQQPNASEHPN